MNLPEISTLNAALSDPDFAEKYPEISLRWQQIRARSLIYSDLSTHQALNISWFHNPKMNRRFTDIAAGRAALSELEQLQLDNDEKNKVEWDIRVALEAQLSFLELKQYKNLIKDQTLYRPEIEVMQDSLKLKLERQRVEMKAKNLSKRFSTPQLHAFFLKQEQFYFDFDKYIDHSQKAGDVISAFSSSVNFGRSIPAIYALITGVGVKLLRAVPALSALSGAAPIILATIRTWAENRRIKKKLIYSGMTLGIIAGIVLAFSFPFLGTIIAGIFTGLSAIKEYVIPAIIFGSMMRKKEKELYAVRANIASGLGRTILDKNILLRKLEQYCMTKAQLSPQEIGDAKNLIMSPDISLEALATHKIIRAITQTHNSHELKTCLLTAKEEHARLITHEIATLKTKRDRSIMLSVLGGITTLGAILFCVPTPATLFVGATLCVVSTLLSIAIRRNFAAKIGRMFTKSPEYKPKKFSTYNIMKKIDVDPKEQNNPSVTVTQNPVYRHYEHTQSNPDITPSYRRLRP